MQSKGRNYNPGVCIYMYLHRFLAGQNFCTRQRGGVIFFNFLAFQMRPVYRNSDNLKNGVEVFYNFTGSTVCIVLCSAHQTHLLPFIKISYLGSCDDKQLNLRYGLENITKLPRENACQDN